jgi:hypothetical protein
MLANKKKPYQKLQRTQSAAVKSRREGAVIKTRHEVRRATLSSLRMRLVLWTMQSSVGLYYNMVQVVLCVLACMLYVAETYWESNPFGFYVAEAFFFTCFTCDYAIQCATSPFVLRFVLSSQGIVDLLSIIPILSLVPQLSGSEIESLSFFSLFRLLRISRILRLYKLRFSHQSALNRRVINLAFTCIALLFCATGLVHAMARADHFSLAENSDIEAEIVAEFTEEEELAMGVTPSGVSAAADHFPRGAVNGKGGRNIAFHECLYFVIVTITTVGYGACSICCVLSSRPLTPSFCSSPSMPH